MAASLTPGVMASTTRVTQIAYGPEGVKAILQQRAWTDAGLLIVFGMVVLAAAVLVMLIFYGMVRCVTQWSTRRASVVSPITNKLNSDDDIIPDDDATRDEYDDVQGDREVSRRPAVEVLRNRMSQVQQKYGEYNRALVSHLQQRDSTWASKPDDVMDRRIMGHGNDDFEYSQMTRS